MPRRSKGLGPSLSAAGYFCLFYCLTFWFQLSSTVESFISFLSHGPTQHIGLSMLFSMPFSSPSTFTTIVCLVALSSWTSAHTVITYPGWRGNNLRNTSTIVEAKGLGVNNDSSEPYGVGYPYGMQWIYPCTSTDSRCAHSVIEPQY